MKILRMGARANHGSKSVALKISKLRWNPTVEKFDLSFASAASDFATDARHIYTLRFGADELAGLLSLLAEAGQAMDPEDFASIYSERMPALFRLQAMASGLKLSA